MNASECCKTIGCNCAGAINQELSTKMSNMPFLAVVGTGILVVLLILIRFIVQGQPSDYEKV